MSYDEIVAVMGNNVLYSTGISKALRSLRTHHNIDVALWESSNGGISYRQKHARLVGDINNRLLPTIQEEPSSIDTKDN